MDSMTPLKWVMLNLSVVYILLVISIVHSVMVGAKTEVAPIKGLSILCLDQSSACLLAQFNDSPCQAAFWTFGYFWGLLLDQFLTHSLLDNHTYSYIEPGGLKYWCYHPLSWSHVPGFQMPADLASWGLLPHLLLFLVVIWFWVVDCQPEFCLLSFTPSVFFNEQLQSCNSKSLLWL